MITRSKRRRCADKQERSAQAREGLPAGGSIIAERTIPAANATKRRASHIMPTVARSSATVCKFVCSYVGDGERYADVLDDLAEVEERRGVLAGAEMGKGQSR